MKFNSIRFPAGLVVSAAFAGLLLLLFVGGCSPQGSSGAIVESTDVKPQPKAVVAEPNFDFGTMESDEVRNHRFVIRNEGDGELQLTLGKTSCKCTSATLARDKVPPGESTEVIVEWRSEGASEYLRQGLTVSTNDRKNPSFLLAIEGKVRVSLGVWPDSVSFAELERNAESPPVTLALYSQLHSDVKIKSVESADPGVSLSLGEPDSTLPVPPNSKYARPLTVRYKAGTKPGSFGNSIRVTFESPTDDRPEPRVLEIPVNGSVVGDISMFGRGVIGKAVVMGMIPQSVGKKQTVYLHVRNSGETRVRLGRVQPEFLQVRIAEPQKMSEKLTRIPIEVEVPPGAPEINLENVNLGEVEVFTTHPDYPSVTFQVSLAVAR